MMGLGCGCGAQTAGLFGRKKGACGIGWFRTDENDPFNFCCERHDKDFLDPHAGEGDETLRQVNARFRDWMALVIINSPEEERPALERRARWYVWFVNGPIGNAAWKGWFAWL